MALDVEVAYLFGFVLVVVGLLVVAVSLIFASRRRSPSGGKAEVRKGLANPSDTPIV